MNSVTIYLVSNVSSYFNLDYHRFLLTVLITTAELIDVCDLARGNTKNKQHISCVTVSYLFKSTLKMW